MKFADRGAIACLMCSVMTRAKANYTATRQFSSVANF